MRFWTIYILSILLAAASVTTGIPLRTSDLGQNGHIVHYHRDELSGGHRRHIHYRPAFNRFQKTSRNTFLQNHGTPVNPAAIYEVPSNRHFNDALAGRVAIELRSLVDQTKRENTTTADVKNDNSDNGDSNNSNGKYDSNNGNYENSNGKYDNGKYESSNGNHDSNNGKNAIHHKSRIHRLQNRDAPTPPSEMLPTGNVHFPAIEALPQGLQFLNKQSQERQLQNQANNIAAQSNGMQSLDLDLNKILGEIVETTVSPSVTPSDAFLSESPVLDLAFLLGDLQSAANGPGPHLGDHVHGHGHQSHDHVHQSHDNSHQTHGHGHQSHGNSHQNLDHGHHGPDHGNQGHTPSHQATQGPDLGQQSHFHSHSSLGHDLGHGTQVHSQSQDHGHGTHQHGHSMTTRTDNHQNKNSIHDKVIDSNASGPLGNLFNGKFNQPSPHSMHGHGDHVHHEVNTLPSTNTVSAGIYYQQSTVHARPITKRGVSDGDSVPTFHKTFIDNILNIRIDSTTPPPPVVQTTQPTRYSGYLTTPRSVETQIKRLSRNNLNGVKQTDNGLIRKDAFSGNIQPQQESTPPAIVSPSPKEMVHLQGIHIMFSDGKQDTTGTIPTVHLTASVSDNVNHLLKMAAGGSNAAAKAPNINSITDKITGTAVIRDGHLYLVVYPFGNNKSLELHYNQTTKRMPMPHNKPVPFSGVSKPNDQTKTTPRRTDPIKTPVSVKSTSPAQMSMHFSSAKPVTPVKPTSQTKISSTNHADHHHASSTGSDMHSTAHTHGHVSKPDVSTQASFQKSSIDHNHHQQQQQQQQQHQHHHQHQHHNHHHHASHMPSLTGLKLAEVNDTTLQTLLAPIDRFVSPWDSLNLSKVFPYSAGKSTNKTSSKKNLEEDSEVDVVTFVAKATDPFDRMKVIIESLVNKTLLDTVSTPASGNASDTKQEARFNFELKLQSSNLKNTKDKKQSTTNPSNSEEMAFDTNVKGTTVNSKQFEKLSTVTLPIPTSDFTTTMKPFGEVSADSFGMSSAEMTTPSTSISTLLNGESNLQSTTETYHSHIVTNSTTNKHDIKPGVSKNDNAVNSQTVKPVSKQTSKTFDSILHVNKNAAPTTSTTSKRLIDFSGTTMSYVPNYTKSKYVRQPMYQITTPSTQNVFPDNRKIIPRKIQAAPRRNTVLGSNLQPFVQRTSPNRYRQGLHRGQSEQIISLADILNDIRRIQLHNMQRFNIQNNNFDTMILSEAQQKPVVRTPLVMEGPVVRETSKRRYSDFPAFANKRQQIHRQRFNPKTPSPTPIAQRRFGRHATHEPSVEAMLVLSVDDIMSDETALHGAIVVSHRRDPSYSNKT